MWRKLRNPFPSGIGKIGIAAPASRPEPKEIASAVKLLQSWGLEAKLGQSLDAGGDAGYLSSTDDLRLDDLNSLIRDETVDLILCARGGYGSMRILKEVDWKTLKKRKLPVLGYSDITALHLGMLAKGAGRPIVCGMANKLRKTLSNQYSAEAMERAFAVGLEGRAADLKPVALPEGRKLKTLKPGSAQGPLIPVNLTLLAALAGTEFLPDFSGALLLVEDIGEKPRTIDRMLAQLELSGILGKIAGLVLGDFTDCGAESEILQTLTRYLGSVKGPVASGLPFGHALPSLAFSAGEIASLDDASLKLSQPPRA